MSASKFLNNVSVICSCKNRIETLRVTISSWLNFKEIKEIIIVDWNSDNSIEFLLSYDERITIIKVPDQKYFNQPQPLNLALSRATGDYILKLDTDYIINPYYNFFDLYSILDETNYICGRYKYSISEQDYYKKHMSADWSHDDNHKYVKSYLPIYKYLFGLLFIDRKNLLKIGGYNEIFSKYYAYEDDEICDRLELFGLEQIRIDYDDTLLHIPHPDKKRIENFEGIGKSEEERIRHNLSAYYEGNELQWQLDYALATLHIDLNKKEHQKVENYHVQSKLNWNIVKIKDRYYEAKSTMTKSKLENFPIVNYISLEESTDRRNNLHKEFGNYGITVFSPFISKRYEEGDHLLFGSALYHLDGGSKGCVVSHIEMIKEWYNNTDEEYGFFCEDDLSLDPIQYWNFTWEEFVEKLPEDAECVQLYCIRESQSETCLRYRLHDDWSVTCYIMTRNYAKRIIDRYIKDGGYDLQIDGGFYPMPENVLFNNNLGQVYAINLFTETQDLESTFTKSAKLETGLKKYHVESYNFVVDWWKNIGYNKNINEILSFFDEKDKNKLMVLDIEELLEKYSQNTEDPELNYYIANWYELQGHNAPGLSFFLRCAERSEDDLLSYESLIHAANCYDRQGTRDLTTKGILQQAMTLLPTRPEAYYLLSLFTEKRSQWQECYFYADTALNFADLGGSPLRTDVGYIGKIGLLLQKSVAGWWWGKNRESRDILLDLRDNYDLPDGMNESVLTYLKKYVIDKDSKYMTEDYVKIFNEKEIFPKEEKKKINLGKMDLVLAGHYDEQTSDIIDSYLKLSFVNNIIISTWEDCDTDWSDDERVIMIKSGRPTPGTDNRNYQIVTSQSGLNEVTTEYCARMRTDQKYSLDSMEKMYEYMSENKEMDGSIFVAGIYPNLQFHPRDHIFWGLIEDLIKLFDVPLEKDGFSDKMNISKNDLWKYYNFFERTETYIGSRYCMRFCREVTKFIMQPELYLYDGSLKWEESHEVSNKITSKIFKSFPREGIDLEWNRKGLQQYPYDDQKNGYGECWAEDIYPI